MKILIAGSSGLVGTALVESLGGAGHTVCRLLRPESPGKAAGARPSVAGRGDPGAGELEGAGGGGGAVGELGGGFLALGGGAAGGQTGLFHRRGGHAGAAGKGGRGT